MRINRIIISLVINIVLAGCSLTGKAIYFEPIEQDNWDVRIGENYLFGPPTPAMAEHKCGNMNIIFRSAEAGQQFYTGGPMMIPVIPIFGIFNAPPGKHGMTVFLLIAGPADDPGLGINSISILLDQNQKKINADEFGVQHYGVNWSYYYIFKSSLLSVEKLTLVPNKTIQNCSIPSILYEKKGHPFIALFWLPAEVYR